MKGLYFTPTMESALIEKVTGWLITFVTAMVAGSAVALMPLWKNEDNVKITKTRVALSIFFACLGAFYLAPFVVEYLSLVGGGATLAGFICAFLGHVVLEIISTIADQIKTEVPNVFLKWILVRIKKIMGHGRD